MPDHSTHPIQISARLIQILGAASVAVFVPAGIAAVLSGAIMPAVIFVPLIAGGLFSIVVAAGTIELDAETIALQRGQRRDCIRWDEVRSIEMAGDTIIFYGADKRLVLIEPQWWRGPARAAALALLARQIDQRELIVKYNLLATFKRSRGTRVA